MNCPVCTAALRRISYEGVHIHTCDGCGGEFVGPGQIAHIVNIREAKFAQATPTPKPHFGLPEDQEPRSLACPGCAGAMTSVNYAGDTGILVDRCGSCQGMWLEASELERIQHALEQWQDAAPRRIQSLSRELAHAQRQRDTAASGAFAGSRFAFVNAIINRIVDAAA